MNNSNPIMEYNDMKKHTILIVDDSQVIRKVIDYMLKAHNYSIIHAVNGLEALKVLENKKIDFIITDINMPEIGGFDLISRLKKLGLDLPYIMITDSDINKYLELAIKYNVGNILSKPIEKTELLHTVYKLLNHKSLFGLSNYLNCQAENLKTIYIDNSKQCDESVSQIVNHAKSAGMESEFLPSLKLILSEMAINALYHPHGFEKKKKEGESIKLKEGDKIEVQFGKDDNRFGVSITDFEGKLTKLGVLQTFKEFVDNNNRLMKALEKGEDPSTFMKDSGRGLQMAREMSNEYYFNIRVNKLTQIIILIWMKKIPILQKSQSIKINEIN